MNLEELRKEHSNVKGLLLSQKEALNSLFEELGFQQSIALYSHLCEVLNEDMVIEYRGISSSRKEYLIKFLMENGKLTSLTDIYLKNVEDNPKNTDKVDFSPSNNYYDYLTEKDKYIKFSTLGKISEIIYKNQKDLLTLLNSTAEEIREEIEKSNNLINEYSEKMNKLAFDHKLLSFINFKSDLEKGVEFLSSRDFPKTLNKDLYVKRFKITHYSASKKTVYFKYTSGWSSDPSWNYNEAMVEKIEDFFEMLYGGIEGSYGSLEDKYSVLDETPKINH